MRKPTKMVGCLILGLADHRQVQVTTDHASDVAERNVLFGNPVIPGSRGTLLKRKPKQLSSIESVHSRPAIASLAYVRRNALFTCNA